MGPWRAVGVNLIYIYVLFDLFIVSGVSGPGARVPGTPCTPLHDAPGSAVAVRTNASGIFGFINSLNSLFFLRTGFSTPDSDVGARGPVVPSWSLCSQPRISWPVVAWSRGPFVVPWLSASDFGSRGPVAPWSLGFVLSLGIRGSWSRGRVVPLRFPSLGFRGSWSRGPVAPLVAPLVSHRIESNRI